MNTDVMFSSNDMTWETPLQFFRRVNFEFNFDLDVCALPQTAKCEKYFTPEIDGLAQKWAPHVCWMNPPYGREITAWMEKAYYEALRGAIVVCLIPSRTDSRYWVNYCMKASEIRFVKGRIKFGDSKNSAPFPSALVIFNYYNWDGVLRTTTYDKDGIKPVHIGTIQPVTFIKK